MQHRAILMKKHYNFVLLGRLSVLRKKAMLPKPFALKPTEMDGSTHIKNELPNFSFREKAVLSKMARAVAHADKLEHT